MKHTYMIEAESAAEFREQVLDLAAQFTPTAPAACEQPLKAGISLEPGAMNTVAHTEAPKAEPKSEVKKGKAKKAEVEAAPVAEIKAAEPDAEEETTTDDPFATNEQPVITMEDILSKLKEVAKKVGGGDQEKGIEASKKILSQFGARNVSAVKEADYPKFIAVCEKALK
jgi:hypothetical protein